MISISIYLLNAVGLTPGGSSTVHIYTQTIYKARQSIPLETWSGPEGSRKLRFPDFMTKAQDGAKVVNLTHRPPLTPGNTPGTHFC